MNCRATQATTSKSATPVAGADRTLGVFQRLYPSHLGTVGKLLAAPVATLAALVVQLAVLPKPSSTPFIIFFLGVALAAWLAGSASGLFAVWLTVVTADYFFLSGGAFWHFTHARFIAECTYVLSASGIALLCGSLHAALARAETAARLRLESETEYRSLFDNMQEGLAFCRMQFRDGVPYDYRYLTVNSAFERLTGLNNASGKWVTEVIPGVRDSDPELFATLGRVASSGMPEVFELYVSALKMWFRISAYCPKPEHFVAVFDVITERKQLEEQLRHSQKMEAIGCLAGGVAHDFNNMLTSISGNLSLAMLDSAGQENLLDYLGEASQAADSAACLTRQLLAFSRKQLVAPKVFDLNEAIQSMYKMLSRTIGDAIELKACPVPDLAPVRVDPGQIEQILVNLAVNAKDAMPDGGTLTLETANVVLDEHYCRLHTEVRPGNYVQLAVSDTGCGMSFEVSSRCFDPFFTTKPKDKGTGLGLSTIYGIVKQARGSIEVYSEVGHGTIVKVYLPRASEAPVEFALPGQEQSMPSGTETIFLVEDDAVVRRVALRSLRKLGYYVLDFGDATEALKTARDYPRDIHLLITDVVMPRMNGQQLSTEMRTIRPKTRVLFMSGYSENIIAHNGVLDSGIHFIGKPYAVQNLATKVREVLDAA
jgi:signal transduction histidine kinase/ActR/RegA family two-component response regulator